MERRLALRHLPAALALACFLVAPAAAAEEKAQDEKSTNEAAAKVDALVAELAGSGQPGCALGVIRDGALVYARGFGLANVEHGVPITSSTVFDIGSTSKQFTAAAVLLLAQDGKLALDDDVRRFVPEVPDFGQPVTIRHLLHHTSGIRDYIDLLFLAGVNLEDVCTDADALGILSRQRALDFPPGSEHSYSNSGYFLLSIIVERASGQRLADFLRERVFVPLGMTHTLVLNEHTRVVPHHAAAYSVSPDGTVTSDLSNWEQTGDGAVQTTVGDLALWDRNFYDPQVGGPGLIRELQVPGRLADGTPIDYARGLRVSTYRGLRTVDHAGAWAGFRAQLLRFPDDRLTTMALCNFAQADPSGLAYAMADAYLADRFAPAPASSAGAPPAALPGTSLDRFAGLYFSPTSNLVRRLVVHDGKLFYSRDPGNETELAASGEGRFQMVGAAVPTTLAATGTPPHRQLAVRSGENPPVRFEEVEPGRISAAELAGLAGWYDSPELDTRWRLDADGESLVVRGKRGPASPFAYLFADTFGDGGSTLHLLRGPTGEITGFEVGVGRARHIAFVRAPAPASH